MHLALLTMVSFRILKLTLLDPSPEIFSGPKEIIKKINKNRHYYFTVDFITLHLKVQLLRPIVPGAFCTNTVNLKVNKEVR